jgi:tetratricopeptide (TPR) repeat protein
MINIKENKKQIAAWLIFLLMLVVYFITACRTVPPYRDSGELITSAATLSVAHSPGYPAYIILGKIFISLFGVIGVNPAWAMNLFSALAGAFAVFFILLVIYEMTDNLLASIFGALLTGFSYMNWYLAVVAEMYSLNLMFIAILLFLLLKKKYMLFSFVTGLMFGNHLSSLFAVLPLAAYILVKERKVNDIPKMTLTFIIGLAVYVFLLVRAAGSPFINWGDPSTLTGFWRVISRASYGHTLDLVSREVTLQQVLLPQLKIFFKTLFVDLSPSGFILATIGIVIGFLKYGKNNRIFNAALLLMFFLTGPFFIYMAKMPVNKHAVAILEVCCMIPEMILAVFAGLTVAFVAGLLKTKTLKRSFMALLSVLIVVAAANTYSKVDKQNNYIADDYALNILNVVEENSVVIMRRDHTLFALWYKRYLENVRDDVKVISKGLLSAKWYREKLRLDHPEILWKEDFIGDEDYIEWLYVKYSKEINIYMTPAAAGELSKEFYEKYSLNPYGLVLKIAPKGENYDPDKINQIVKNNFRYRSNLKVEEYYDYFSGDIVGLYARFYDRLGLEYLKTTGKQPARRMYIKAMEIDPSYSRPYANLAYSYFSEGNNEEAQMFYIKAIRMLEREISLHTRKQFFMKDLAELYNNLGAVYENSLKKTGKKEYFQKALTSYNRALRVMPAYSQAYYNLGVLYWYTKDWKKVIENFEYALKYNPGKDHIKKYLATAKRNLRQN